MLVWSTSSFSSFYEDAYLIFSIGVNGFLDKIPVNKVTQFESAVIPYVQANAPEIFEAIKKENAISAETDRKIKEVLGSFVKDFS